MSDVMENGSRFVRDFGKAVNRNPVPAALIGVGVLWLFASRIGAGKARSILERVSNMAGDAADTASSTFSSAASRASRATAEYARESAEAAQEGAADNFDQVSSSGRQRFRAFSEYARQGPEKGARQLDDLGANLTDMFRRQPLAMGAIGIAIGAGIAAALPLTETETEHLGEAGDALKERAQEFAGEQTERAKEMAERVARVATD